MQSVLLVLVLVLWLRLFLRFSNLPLINSSNSLFWFHSKIHNFICSNYRYRTAFGIIHSLLPQLCCVTAVVCRLRVLYFFVKYDVVGERKKSTHSFTIRPVCVWCFAAVAWLDIERIYCRKRKTRTICMQKHRLRKLTLNKISSRY